MTIEENWAVGWLKDRMDRYETYKVDAALLHAEHIGIKELQKLCKDNYWYLDPLSDEYQSYRLHKDYLRLDSCTRKICGLIAQEAVDSKIDVWREPIQAMEITDETILGELPETRVYRIQWLSRPLHRIYDAKQEYIPIWHLIS